MLPTLVEVLKRLISGSKSIDHIDDIELITETLTETEKIEESWFKWNKKPFRVC